MLKNILRKFRQLIGDPVLQKWLFFRLLGRTQVSPNFIDHHPPYLEKIPINIDFPSISTVKFKSLIAPKSKVAVDLHLPGLTIMLKPSDKKDIFQCSYDDIETLLALHRFSWLPLCGGDSSVIGWTQTLWNAWCKNFLKLNESKKTVSK